MSKLYDTLVDLSPVREAQLLEGYERYEAILAAILTPEQRDIYAESIRQAGMIRIVEELTPDELAALHPGEQAIASAIQADDKASMENRRVVALLNYYGQHPVAPDLSEVPLRSQSGEQ
jgi:hypothetical protein